MNDDGAPRPRKGQPPVAGQGNADARAEVLAGVDDPGGRTAGQTVEVSQAEAERRCTIVWHNFWGPSAAAVELSDDSGPWFEGDAVEIANAQEFDYSPFDALEHGWTLCHPAGRSRGRCRHCPASHTGIRGPGRHSCGLRPVPRLGLLRLAGDRR